MYIGKTDKKVYLCIEKSDKDMLKRKIDNYGGNYRENTETGYRQDEHSALESNASVGADL